VNEGLIYLDYNASAPVRPEVLAVMEDVFRTVPGNASSIHSRGRRARALVEEARERLGSALGVAPAELIFTGGGSEADNLALKGTAYAHGRGHLITTAIEHPAVLETCRYLAGVGFDLSVVKCDAEARVDPAAILAALRPDTILVSVMAANNEVGTIQDLAGIRAALGSSRVSFHSDSIQALGKTFLDLAPVDMATFSAHKLGGPQGVGALYLRSGTKLHSLVHGGGQEVGMRAGTENVAGIVGFSLAAELVRGELDAYVKRVSRLRDLLEERIVDLVEGVRLHGPRKGRLANTANISFPGIPGEAVVLGLDARSIAVSTGSACSSGQLEPSHVLSAMGVSPEEGKEAVRISLGPDTTREQVLTVAGALSEVVAGFRRLV